MTTPAATSTAAAPRERTADPTLDIELIRRAQEGDADAFASLYRLRINRVQRYVGAIVRNPTRTEDAVAETFLQAWRDLGAVRQPERFDAWLLRIAYRRALRELKQPRHGGLDEAAAIADDRRDGAPQAALEAALTSAEVRAALLALPGAQREVLTLRHLGELSHREIARELGKSEDAARAAYSRAARELRRRLERAAP